MEAITQLFGPWEPIRWFELAGAIAGLLGSNLLASNNAHSKYGWVAFLVSNGCIGTYAILAGAPFLLLMQVGFTYTSLKGVRRWFLSSQPEAENPVS